VRSGCRAFWLPCVLAAVHSGCRAFWLPCVRCASVRSPARRLSCQSVCGSGPARASGLWGKERPQASSSAKRSRIRAPAASAADSGT
jgi:hypothetical protein